MMSKHKKIIITKIYQPMKKSLLLLILISVLFLSCSKEDGATEPEKNNMFIGTSWIADNDIASLIYGKGCTTTIEFISETECQKIDYIPSGLFSGTDVEKGTYYYDGNTVTWTIDKNTITGTASGSVLNTNMGTVSGGKRVYRKK